MLPARGACCLAALVLQAASAFAQVPVEPVHIEFHPTSVCGDQAKFLELVRARTERFQIASPDQEARRFIVDISGGGGRYTGVLRITTPNELPQTREISTPQCNEVFDALALFTALAIDPNAPALVAPRPPPSETEPEPAPKPPPPPPVVEPYPDADGDGETDGDGANAARRQWRFSVGGQATLMHGVAPGWMIGGQVLLDLSLEPSEVLSPSLRVGFRGTRDTSTETESGTADFTLLVGAVEVCPLWFQLSDWFGFRPCAAAELGQLIAAGTETDNERTRERGWAAVGGTLRPVFILHRRVLLELSGSALAPLRRDAFSFGSDTFHEVERLTFVVGAGVTGWIL